MKDVDVIVIGAGFSGLAACSVLRSSGMSVAVLEATGRVGGRARTSHRLQTPVEEGCCWLHQAGTNPLRPISEAHGIEYLPHDDAPFRLYEGGKRLPEDAEQCAEDSLEVLNRRIAGHTGEDLSLLALMSGADWMERWALGVVAPLDGGADPGFMSVAALRHESLTVPNLFVRQGFGHLALMLGDGMPIHKSTRVRRIDSRGHGVEVFTSKGALSASACIITVSTGVLAAESIEFFPALPNDKLAAIEALPMGDYNKAFLRFHSPFPHLSPGEWASEADRAPDDYVHFLLHPFDPHVLLLQAGGRLGRDLALMNEKDGVAWALERLASCFGSDAAPPTVEGFHTGWRVEPTFLGSYSYPRVGQAAAREVIGAPIDGKLFFAGEATAGYLAQTAGGAWLSGIRAANEAMGAIRRPK